MASRGFGTEYNRGGPQAGEQAILLTPLAPPASGTKRGAIIAHGYETSGIYGSTEVGARYCYQPQFSSTYGGPAVAGAYGLAVDAGGPATFGNAADINAITSDWNYFKGLTRVGIKTDQVCLIGGSMGALSVLNWAVNNLALVAAIALIIPALDLQDMHDNVSSRAMGGVSVGSFFPNLATDIEASAGGAGFLTDAYYNAHSPIQFASSLSGIPIQIWEAANDIVTNPSGVSTAAAFAAASGATLVNQGVQSAAVLGHTPGTLTAEQVGAFLSAYV